MKYLLAFLLFISAPAYADWFSSTLTDQSRLSKGIIIHTHAIGMDSSLPNPSIKASLQISCMNQGSAIEQRSLLSLRWIENASSYKPESMEIKIDSVRYPMASKIDWIQHKNILYRPVSHSTELIEAMLSAKQIEFSWKSADSSSQRIIFSLNDFSNNLRTFNLTCQR